MKKKASELYIPKQPVPFFPLDEHGDVFVSKHVHEYDYEDPSFKYRPKNFLFLTKRFFARIGGFLIGVPAVWFWTGLKIKNRRILRKYRKEMKEGFVSVCNHVFSLDCLGITAAFAPHSPEFPMWQDGFESSLGALLHTYGGFPVVRTIHGIGHAYRSMKDVIKEKKWLQVYPEAACWFYYVPIREFESGTFRLAYESQCLVFPLAYSYRPRKGLFKLWNRNSPAVTLTIGEPQRADYSLPRDEAVKKLRDSIHLSVVHLAGIKDEEENEELKKRYSYSEGLLTNIKK